MCGRFTLLTGDGELAAYLESIGMPLFDGLAPRYNICPTQPVACIRHSNDNQLESVSLRWGLVPFWADDLKIGARMINARSETVATKPAFRAAFKSRRCLVLSDGFYEWKKADKSKQPYYISRHDRKPFLMAGLWESWQEKSDEKSASVETVETCTVITTHANEIIQPLHDRMPVILGRQQLECWLDSDFKNRDILQQMLVPCASDQLQTWPVATIVNKPANDQPECIQPIKTNRSLFD